MKYLLLMIFSICFFCLIGQPTSFDPGDSEGLLSWWVLIYGAVMPIGTFVLNWIWPSSTRNELILKSTAAAIVVLLIIITMKGISFFVVLQSILGFVLNVLSYDKVFKPLGMDSIKTMKV